MVKLRSVDVALKLPFVELSGTWAPDDAERAAAWELYVELVTRTAVVELGPEQGMLREALSSLYSLFGTTREILRRYGPDVARPHLDGELSLGVIAVTVLNDGIRPVLSTWHPLLAAHEAQRPAGVSPLDHERAWEHAGTLRAVLAELRQWVRAYGGLLAAAAGVPPMVRSAEPG